MSSKLKFRKNHKLYEKKEIVEESFNIKDFVIPFSKFHKNEKYIYYGYERIPFSERHPEYQIILRNEFAKVIKKIFRK